ncbi:MAG: glycosyltransferase [Acidimicrobiia bacterium]|nr:glycosyltransferase [Acidimicrobiia bacterium]
MIIAGPTRGDQAAPGSGPPRVLFLSTFPPTFCGLATFTEALMRGLTVHRGTSGGMGVVGVAAYGDSPEVEDDSAIARVVPGAPGWAETVAVVAVDYDVLVIQHEFGIYGPDDGIALLDLLEAVTLPVVTIIHSVSIEPTPRQRVILETLVERSAVAVLISSAARRFLMDGYRVDPSRLTVIPHGAHVFTEPLVSPDPRPLVLTWGLLGPGKGIEWAILAMDRLRHLLPQPRYLVQGETHPAVLRREGEAYRNRLRALVADNGLEDMVRIQGGYLSVQDLAKVVSSANIVLLPYDSRDQVSSGVLVEAIAAGKPVVATSFPHAVELLAGGAGRVVRHEDPDSIAEGLLDLLEDPQTAAAAAEAARQLAPVLEWGTVARAYDEVFRAAVARPVRSEAGGRLA